MQTAFRLNLGLCYKKDVTANACILIQTKKESERELRTDSIWIFATK